ENATAAYAQALSAIPLGASDVIVTSRNDYISNQLMFLSLRQRFGVRFVRAQDLPEGGVDPDSVAKLIKRHSPKLVAITHVPTHSGLMQPIVQIGKTCKSFGVPYLVDACQSVGQLPLAVEEIGCDFLSATARKFLRGPRGVGFLYVSDLTLAAGLEPLFIDMRGADWIARDEYRSHDDATRFENWEFAYALLLGTGTAAAYARGVGLDRIGRRTSGLAASIRQHLRHLSGVKVLDHGQNLCGIVAATIAGVDANSCYRQLLERDINTALSFRRYSLIDFAEPGVDWAVRISPHYYNTESEIDELVAAIEEIAS
ncbi:MAG: aminotransferase class V-fold PLP-dependent enzyme, partial [Gemmatimonadales bacterium]